MSDIRWGWLLGSAAVGAALGLLMSSGDARRNPYNGRKKRKVKRQNPADFTDYGLDPSDADFDDKLKAKLEELEKEGVEAKKLAKDIKDSPDDQALKQEFDRAETELTIANARIQGGRKAIEKRSDDLFKELVVEKEGPATSKMGIKKLKTDYGAKYSKDLKDKLDNDGGYDMLVQTLAQHQKDAEAAKVAKKTAKKAWDDLQLGVAKKIRQADRDLPELEQLKYERDLEIDEEEDREFEKNKHYAQKALRRLEGHNTHHKAHSAPKRRVRNNK